VYDEAKRFAEALTMAYHRTHGVQTRIVRIFNTHGPRMRLNDGRVVPNFIAQALRGEPMTVYGDGSQTRSFCYVSDLVEALVRLLRSEHSGPVNCGNPMEVTILQFAERIKALTASQSEIVFRPLPEDDPKVRQPDITRARTLLGWEPRVSLDDGLRKTIDYFRTVVPGA
jgi:dTDP-glucose 4,6-dehydratase